MKGKWLVIKLFSNQCFHPNLSPYSCRLSIFSLYCRVIYFNLGYEKVPHLKVYKMIGRTLLIDKL